MAVISFSPAKRSLRRKRPILAIFRFPGRESVRAWCWSMQELIDAFKEAKEAKGVA